MKISRQIILAFGTTTLAVAGFAAYAQQTPFPLAPGIAMEPNGTLHFKDRIVPMPTLMSAEAKARYLEIITRSLTATPPGAAGGGQRGGAQQAAAAPQGAAVLQGAAGGGGLAATLKVYPNEVQESEMGGVKVTIFTPKNISARNRNRVLMSLNSNAIGAIVANVAGIRTVQVNFAGAAPGAASNNAQVVSVYRELLKSHKPAQIAFIGISGGCQLSANTAVWLVDQKLPFPGALALMTCAGGGVPGDTRVTLDGLDPQLSSFTSFGAGRTGRTAASPPRTVNPGEPPREILEVATIPKGFPPSYLLSGTRDLSLSQTVLLHRKLRNAGVIADLNIWEGMWHGFNFEPLLPETREAAGDLARFLDKYLGT